MKEEEIKTKEGKGAGGGGDKEKHRVKTANICTSITERESDSR